MPDQDLDWIRARVLANLDEDDGFAVLEPFVRFARGLEVGRVDRGNPIFGRTSRKDFAVWDVVPAEVCAELALRAAWGRFGWEVGGGRLGRVRFGGVGSGKRRLGSRRAGGEEEFSCENPNHPIFKHDNSFY